MYPRVTPVLQSAVESEAVGANDYGLGATVLFYKATPTKDAIEKLTQNH